MGSPPGFEGKREIVYARICCHTIAERDKKKKYTEFQVQSKLSLIRISRLPTVRTVSLVLGESPTFAVFQPWPRGNPLDTKVHLQSTLYKNDTFGTESKRPSYRFPFYLGVRLVEVSVQRESTVCGKETLRPLL